MKNDEVAFQEAVGPLRYLTANVYRGELLIHIREYKEQDGLVLPTRKEGSVFRRNAGDFSETAWKTFRNRSSRWNSTNPWIFQNILELNISSLSGQESDALTWEDLLYPQILLRKFLRVSEYRWD